MDRRTYHRVLHIPLGNPRSSWNRSAYLLADMTDAQYKLIGLLVIIASGIVMVTLIVGVIWIILGLV
jgi:uncharacterized membrane protein YciS (DUF1049 family)